MQLEILLKSEIPYEAQEYHEHRIDTFKYVFERLFLDQYASRIVSNPVIEFEYNPVNGKFKLKSIPHNIAYMYDRVVELNQKQLKKYL